MAPYHRADSTRCGAAFTAEAFATVLAYAIYEISHHSEIQSELGEELRSISNPLQDHQRPADIPDTQLCEQLPLLNAVIREGLRLRNTSPNADPRVTPADRYCSVGILQRVPPGTRSCSFGWCLHRDPDAYPDPLTWSPKRWLDYGCNDIATAKKWFFAFGAGSRRCIGQHLATECKRLTYCDTEERVLTLL